MKYYNALSGGVASAVATQRSIDRYGSENVELVFSDVGWEDEDLYRFLEDLEKHWGKKIIRFDPGMKPLELADKKKLIFSQSKAPCSYELKVAPFLEYLKDIEKPVTVLVGISWTESHRNNSVKGIYEMLEGVSVDFPLQWDPISYDRPIDVVKGWGIEPPRLYSYGFPHNNCGGRCVRQGITEWRRLLQTFPERFEEVRDWEKAARSHGDARENFAICRRRETINGKVESFPLTLEELERTENEKLDDYGGEDIFSCMCGY